MKAEPIPERMRHLPVDRRGYPVPVIVVVKDGKPLFSVNDMDVTNRMIAEDRCSICGGKLFRGRWLVGGCLSALAEHGKFADAPVHDECVHYAMKVCPYLATPRWKGTVGPQQHAQSGLAGLAFGIESTEPERPEAFVAVMASKVDIEVRPFGLLLCRPRKGHVQRVEVWRHGRLLSGDELAPFRDHARRQVERHSTLRTDIWRMIGGAA